MKGTCTNLTLFHKNHMQSTSQATILSLLLVYIILINTTVVVVTIWSAELRGCLFSMQMVATYVGNIFGGASLIGNDIYFAKEVALPICQRGVDHYAFLYFGLSMNMIVLVLNTRYRYKGISRLRIRIRNPQESRAAVKTKISF